MTRIIRSLIVLLIGFFALFSCQQESPVDWTPTFDSSHKIPYGTYVLHQELQDLFPHQTIVTIDENTYDYFSNRGLFDFQTNANYFLIDADNSFHNRLSFAMSRLDSATIMELLSFAGEYEGNLFLSLDEFPKEILDTLGIRMDSVALERIGGDTLSKGISLIAKNKKFKYQKAILGNAFSWDSNRNDIDILGQIKTDNKELKPNYIRVGFGYGHVYLHAEPFAFTNYHMLKKNHAEYVAACMAFINDSEIHWDNHLIYKRQFPESNSGHAFSSLAFILENPPLKWALFLLLSGAILYLMFNSKRRIRPVLIKKPRLNQTLEFVRDISLLYQYQENKRDVARAKVNYFLDNIRGKYGLKADLSDEKFAQALSSKTRVEERICLQLVKQIRMINEKGYITQNQFLNLATNINAFNNKIKQNESRK